MNETELLAQAAAYAKATTISADEYLNRVRNNPAYAYKNTNWYRAVKKLQAVKDLAPSPPPPPSGDVSVAQSWICLGENPKWALSAPLYYKFAITADLGYRHYYDADFFQQARDQGRVLAPWCDSKPSGGTPPSVAIQWMNELGLPFWIGEGESAEAFDNAFNATPRAKFCWVNLSALRPDQHQRIKNREILAVVELYRNCNGNQQPDWRNLNEGIGGNLIAIYRDGQCAGMPLAQYIADGMFVARRDSVYGPQFTIDDYRALP